MYPDAVEVKDAVSVGLVLTISEAGEVESAEVSENADPAFEKAAITAARGLRFSPALQDGAPVAVRLAYTYHFAPPPPAETSVLQGQVRERGTGKPLGGARLVRYRSEEVLGESDEAGRFRLILPRKQHIIVVKAPGFEPITVVENLQKGDSLEAVYRLLAAVSPDPYVTVVRDEQSREEYSRHSLYGREAREAPGTLGDPFRAVMLMPGVGGLMSGISYPVVRGTQPASTAYFVDGIRIPALYHLGAGHAVVHPELIDQLDFYPGTPPSRFGRVLGGVVDARTRALPEDRAHGFASLDLLNLGGLIEAPLGADTRVSASGRLSTTPLILGLVASAAGRDERAVVDFFDYQGRLERDLAGGKLRLFALGSYDNFGFQPLVGGGGTLLHQLFHRVDLRYARKSSLGTASASVTWGYDSTGVLSGGAPGGGSAQFALNAQTFSARASLESQPSQSVHLSSGAEVERRIGGMNFASQKPGGESGPAFTQPSVLTVMAGAWAHGSWRPNPLWTLAGGLRLDSYHLTPGILHGAFEPNLSLHFQPHPAVGLKLAAGWMHQPPTVLFTIPTLDLAGLRYGLQEGAQTSARVDWAPASWLELSVEGYYTRLTRTHEFNLTDVLEQQLNGTFAGQERPGSGNAYGLELMLKHPMGNGWFGWLSYSLQRSERLTTVLDLERYRSEGVVEAREQLLPFAFDQTHNLNAALNYQLPGRITVGASVHFNTGRPESGQLTSRTHRVVTDASGVERWEVVSLDKVDRLPPFLRLDFRISKLFARDDHFVELYLDVLNALLREETLAFTYTREQGDPARAEKKPMALPLFLPMVGVKGGF